jgi:hypothetical protein
LNLERIGGPGVDFKELDGRREAAQRDAERVKRTAPRIRLLNTPLHRDLDGECGGELGEHQRAESEPTALQPSNPER